MLTLGKLVYSVKQKKPTTVVGLMLVCYCFLSGCTLQVEMPKGAYSGQKFTKLVNRKIPAAASSTIPKVPLITLVKKSTAMSAATATLIIRSADPIFFFMISVFFSSTNTR